MANNYDRITAIDAFRKAHPTAQESVAAYNNASRERDPIATLILIATWTVIGGLCAYGAWQHFADPDPYATRVIRECEVGGGIAHKDLGGDGRVLGVRCEKAVMP